MDVVILPLYHLISWLLQAYLVCIFVSVVLSWLVTFNVINTSNQFVYMVGNFLYRITEPALRPIRRFLPNLGGIDISPVILILAIVFLQDVLGRLVYRLV